MKMHAPAAKLSVDEVRVIRTLLARRPAKLRKMKYYSLLADAFSVRPSTIEAIRSGYSWYGIKPYGKAINA
jgi:hypothetical protein